MDSRPTEKLPQNLKDLLKDIGENSVLFQIYARIHNTEWQAFKNLAHSGCDIVLLNLITNRIIKIEVKTRQSLYSTATSRNTENQREFEVTRNEFNNLDLLICYWFDFNAYFVIPRTQLNGAGNSIKIKIRRNPSTGGYGNNDQYLNNWAPLIALLDQKQKVKSQVKQLIA